MSRVVNLPNPRTEDLFLEGKLEGSRKEVVVRIMERHPGHDAEPPGPSVYDLPYHWEWEKVPDSIKEMIARNLAYTIMDAAKRGYEHAQADVRKVLGIKS